MNPERYEYNGQQFANYRQIQKQCRMSSRTVVEKVKSGEIIDTYACDS